MSKGSSKAHQAKVKVLKIRADKPRCGLCGKVKNLPKTECCDNGICEDEANDKLFSDARNRGHRNHRRYPLGAYHHNEGHLGDWKTCAKCRPSFEAEIQMWYGTNGYNLAKLEDPPSYEPTQGAKGGVVIKRGTDGDPRSGEVSGCEQCGRREMEKRFRQLRNE